MPVRIMRAASPVTRSGAPSGFGGGAARPARRSAPVQKCFSPAAVITTARTSKRAARVGEVLDDPVADLGRDRVPGVGPVERQPEDLVLDRASSSSSTSGVVADGSGTSSPLSDRPGSRDRRSTCAPPARRGRPRRGASRSSGLTSSSTTSSARSSARRCTFMITSTSASTSAGFAPRTPSSSGKPCELAQHAVGLVAPERRDAERDVAQHLDEHPAEARHDDRSEERVVRDADDHLDAAA